MLYPAELWTRSGPGVLNPWLKGKNNRQLLLRLDPFCDGCITLSPMRLSYLSSLSLVLTLIGCAQPESEVEDLIVPDPACDWDQDGYVSSDDVCGGDDCDDDRSDIYPGRQEACNFDDDNCDGEINEGLDCTVYGATETQLLLVDPFLGDTGDVVAPAPPGLWLDIAFGNDGSLWALGDGVVWKLQNGFWAEVGSHPLENPSGFCESFDGHFWLLAGRELMEWSPVLGELRRYTAPLSFFGSGDCVDIKGKVYLTDLSTMVGGDALWTLSAESGDFSPLGLTGVDKLYGLARVEGVLVALSGDGETVIIDAQTADAFVSTTYRNYNYVGAASAKSYQNVMQLRAP